VVEEITVYDISQLPKNKPGSVALLQSMKDDSGAIIMTCPNCGEIMMIPDEMGANKDVKIHLYAGRKVKADRAIHHKCGVMFTIQFNKLSYEKVH